MSDKPSAITNEILQYSSELLSGIAHIIETSRKRVAVSVLSESAIMNWSIGNYINSNFKNNKRTEYGRKILATVSQVLTGFFLIKFTGKEWFAEKLHRAIEIAKQNTSESD